MTQLLSLSLSLSLSGESEKYCTQLEGDEIDHLKGAFESIKAALRPATERDGKDLRAYRSIPRWQSHHIQPNVTATSTKAEAAAPVVSHHRRRSSSRKGGSGGMGFLDLLLVASMPPLQVLLIAVLGALLATERCGILTLEARRYLNKVVFYVFTPSLIFGSLASTITLQDIVSWWFMPVNIGIIFLCGSMLGWVVVKLTRPEPHLRGLVIASCSAGNLGNLMIMVIPAICDEDTDVFGRAHICRNNALSYASFSMALGGFYIWTHTYSLMRESSLLYKKMSSIEEGNSNPKVCNADQDATRTSQLLKNEEEHAQDTVVQCSPGGDQTDQKPRIWKMIKGVAHQLAEELLSPPTCSSFAGFVVGAMPWLKSLIIGPDAPLRVVEDSIKLLGDGTIPGVTLILGGNLTKGMSKSSLRKMLVVAIVLVRYVVSPLVGIGIVKGVAELDLLPLDPLFQYALLMQYTLPPAMNIGTMAELFDVGQEECSVIFLWTYMVAAFALTGWSSVYLWILSSS